MTNHVMEQMNTTGRAGKMSYENMLLANVVEGIYYSYNFKIIQLVSYYET